MLVVLIALELLELGPAGVGWLNSAWGVGGVIGGASAVLLLARGRNATGLLLGGAARRRAADRARARCPTTGVAVIGLSCSASATR